MRDHSKHICLASEEAVATMLEKIEFERRTEFVRIQDALNRVTAQDCYCQYDLPNKLSSRMDAIAVRWDDFKDGMPDVSTWKRGEQWVFANTGTAIEGDYDTCLLIEQVVLDENEQIVELLSCPKEKGDKTIPVGSRAHKGDLILPAGTLLTPVKLSALAMGGNAQVEVVAKPKVIFIPTGDELVPVDFPLPLGKTIEANSLMIQGKLQQWGAQSYTHPILGDDWDVITAAVQAAVKEYDIVILNAGSSKGSKDFNIEILDEIGEVICHEVNHGPGHHSSYSIVEGTPVVGISGPPSGAEYTTDWYLRPLVEKYLYGNPKPALRVKAKLAEDLPVRKPHGQAKTAPGTTKDNPGPKMFGAKRCVLVPTQDCTWELRFVERGKAPELVGEDTANAFFRFKDEHGGSPAGTEVEVELRYPYTYPGAEL